MTQERKADLCDELIDSMCECYGVKNTILQLSYLIDKEEILSLGFNKEDVEDVYKNREG